MVKFQREPGVRDPPLQSLNNDLSLMGVNFATDIQLIPVRKIGQIIQGFSYAVFKDLT